MIPSSTPCGACGSPTLVKNFRGAQVHVCQHCQRVTMSKADFKGLVSSRTGDFTPEALRNYDDSLLTEATEEIEKHEANAFAATEVDHTSYGAIAIDEDPRAGVFDLAAIDPGTPTGATAHQDVASYSDDAFELELEAYQERKTQRGMMLAVGVGMVLLVLAAVGVLTAGVGYIITTPQVVAVPQAASTAATPPPRPAPAKPTPTPAAPQTKRPVPTPPNPAPAAPPTPVKPVAPTPPVPQGPASLVKAGWQAFDRDPAKAEGLFTQALERAPTHSEANYGYGYVLLKRGQSATAKPYLCRALTNGDAQTAREIRALLSKNALTCE